MIHLISPIHVLRLFFVVFSFCSHCIGVEAAQDFAGLTELMKRSIDSRWNANMARLDKSPHPDELNLYLTVLLLSLFQSKESIAPQYFQADTLDKFLKAAQLLPSHVDKSVSVRSLYEKYRSYFDLFLRGQLTQAPLYRIVVQIPSFIQPLYQSLHNKGCIQVAKQYRCLYSLVIDRLVRHYGSVCVSCLTQQDNTQPLHYMRKADLLVTVWRLFEVIQSKAYSTDKDPIKFAIDYFAELYLNRSTKLILLKGELEIMEDIPVEAVSHTVSESCISSTNISASNTLLKILGTFILSLTAVISVIAISNQKSTPLKATKQMTTSTDHSTRESWWVVLSFAVIACIIVMIIVVYFRNKAKVKKPKMKNKKKYPLGCTSSTGSPKSSTIASKEKAIISLKIN